MSSLGLFEESIKEALNRSTKCCGTTSLQRRFPEVPEPILQRLSSDLIEEIKTGVLLDFDTLVQSYHLDAKMAQLDQLRAAGATGAGTLGSAPTVPSTPVSVDNIAPEDVVAAQLLRAKLAEKAQLTQELLQLQAANQETYRSIVADLQRFDGSMLASLS
jgi:hypothetical protein